MENCAGAIDKKGNKCYGELFGKAPLAFGSLGKRKIMVITEQPREGGPEGKRRLKNYLKRLADGKKSEPSANLATDTRGSLVEYFGNEFVQNVLDETKGNYYWTHFIKCPFIKNTRQMLNDVCARKWVLKEIEEKQPELIIAFGANASNFILRETKASYSWTEYIWEKELTLACRGRDEEINLESLRINIPVANSKKEVETLLFIMLHPSRQSSLGRFLNEKLRFVLQSVVRRTLSD